METNPCGALLENHSGYAGKILRCQNLSVATQWAKSRPKDVHMTSNLDGWTSILDVQMTQKRRTQVIIICTNIARLRDVQTRRPQNVHSRRLLDVHPRRPKEMPYGR